VFNHIHATVALHKLVELSQVDPSFRALSGRLKFTVRRHKFNKDSLFDGASPGPACALTCPRCSRAKLTDWYASLSGGVWRKRAWRGGSPGGGDRFLCGGVRGRTALWQGCEPLPRLRGAGRRPGGGAFGPGRAVSPETRNPGTKTLNPNPDDRLRVGWLNGHSLGGVPREQKMIKGHLPRVIYHQEY